MRFQVIIPDILDQLRPKIFRFPNGHRIAVLKCFLGKEGRVDPPHHHLSSLLPEAVRHAKGCLRVHGQSADAYEVVVPLKIAFNGVPAQVAHFNLGVRGDKGGKIRKGDRKGETPGGAEASNFTPRMHEQ